MENIDLARFNFDISGVLEQASKLKAEMEEIKAEQKEMDKTSPEFVQTEADLRRLRKEYNEHIKVINQASEATQEVENRQERLNAVLDQEVTSIKEAREQNKVLNALRNETNLTTEEGRAELALLNEQLNRNNQFIKENVDAYTQQKINIGNYSESIVEAYQEIERQKQATLEQRKELVRLRDEQEKGSKQWNQYNQQINDNSVQIEEYNTQINVLINNMGEARDSTEDMNTVTRLLNGNFGDVAETMQDAGGATQVFTSAGKGAIAMMRNLIASAVAFIATPIGAVLAAIGAAFLLVRNAMNRSEESTNKLRTAFSAFRGIATAVQRVLEPLGEFLIDVIVVALEKTEEAAMGALRAMSRAASWLGWDQAADSVDRFTDSLERNAEANRQLSESEAQLRKSRRESQLIQKEYETQAERLRQIRDDEARSIEERIRANEELGRVLEQQLQDELQIAYQALDVVQQRIALEGETEDLLDARADALLEIADIENRITGQRSGQLTNMRSLEKERQKLIEERRDARRKEQEEEEAEAERARQRAIEAQNEMQRRIEEHAQMLREKAEERRLEEIELRELAFAEEIDQMIKQGESRFAIEQAQQEEQRRVREEQLKYELENNLITKRIYDARMAELDREAKNQELERERALQEQKLDIAEGMMAAAAKVIDQNSAAGKAIAIAQALINTYRGISAGVALGFPQAIPAVAYAAATGFKAVKDIAKQDVPSAQGRGTATQGANTPQTTTPMTNLTGQGVNLSQMAASGNTTVQQNIEATLNSKSLVDNVAKGVEEGARRGSMEGSSQGITNLSENRQVQQQSTF